MTARRDLGGREDALAVVTEFYRRAFDDALLGPVFRDVARLDLPAHLPVMADFWATVLFRAGTYRGNLLSVHAALDERAPLTAAHFTRWLALWTATVDELFAGEKADLAKSQAERIAASVVRRLRREDAGELVTIRRRDQVEAGSTRVPTSPARGRTPAPGGSCSTKQPADGLRTSTGYDPERDCERAGTAGD
ncbi:group III truncated hemoglobin [Saccharothrix syringae]|uniref:group III truncated hemoglobin n=1 Tax=Saccharothrix syringae TaxID=103733 RepID=UPI0007C5C84A|nr:group III truncated hemoglobin [Saccharothrix syringae]